MFTVTTFLVRDRDLTRGGHLKFCRRVLGFIILALVGVAKMCVRELRDKVTSGVVHDANHDADNENISSEVARPSVEGVTTGNGGTECDEWLGADSSDLHDNDANMDPAMPVNEDEFEDFFRQGTIQPNELLGRGGGQPNGESTGAPSPARKLPSLLEEELPPAARTPVAVDETLAARMEANRLKAVERAKARRAMNASSCEKACL